MATVAGHPSGLDDDWALMAPSTESAASSTQDGQATVLFAFGVHSSPLGWPYCRLAFGLNALDLPLTFPFACWLPCALWRWKVVRRRVGLCVRLRLEPVPVAFSSLRGSGLVPMAFASLHGEVFSPRGPGIKDPA